MLVNGNEPSLSFLQKLNKTKNYNFLGSVLEINQKVFPIFVQEESSKIIYVTSSTTVPELRILLKQTFNLDSDYFIFHKGKSLREKSLLENNVFRNSSISLLFKLRGGNNFTVSYQGQVVYYAIPVKIGDLINTFKLDDRTRYLINGSYFDFFNQRDDYISHEIIISVDLDSIILSNNEELNDLLFQNSEYFPFSPENTKLKYSFQKIFDGTSIENFFTIYGISVRKCDYFNLGCKDNECGEFIFQFIEEYYRCFLSKNENDKFDDCLFQAKVELNNLSRKKIVFFPLYM